MTLTLDDYRKWCDEVLDPALKASTDETIDVTVILASEKLKEVLAGRDFTYISADWKDVDGFIEDILDTKFDLRNSSKKVYDLFTEAEHGGSDDYVLIAVQGVVTDDELDIVFDLVHNLGAELTAPLKPKCPKCGKEIEGLEGSYTATVGGYASIFDGELNLQLNEDCKLWELVDEDSVIWYCPECNAELFKAGQEAEMIAFLRCESKEVA